MKPWLDLMSTVLDHGERRTDRTGVGTLSLFGLSAEFDNESSFPAVTAKRLAFGQVKAELACFLHGLHKLTDFHAMGCKIWDANGTAPYWKPRFEGDLGRIYGVQWRDWVSVDRRGRDRHTDQLSDLIAGLQADPNSRRHVVTALNPGEMDAMCLPPCHVLWQAYVRGHAVLDMRVDMRSVDLFLGLPFDVASYALLQRLIARDVGLRPGRLVFQLGDAHVYLNHVEQARTVLGRAPRMPPDLLLAERTSTLSFMPADAELVGYVCHETVAAPMNV